MNSPDGREYNGGWQNNKKHGFGELTAGFGKQPKKGKWKEGRFIAWVEGERVKI